MPQQTVEEICAHCGSRPADVPSRRGFPFYVNNQWVWVCCDEHHGRYLGSLGYEACIDCGLLDYPEDLHRGRCDSCLEDFEAYEAEESEAEASDLHSYGFKPDPVFFKTGKERNRLLYMGVEHELEVFGDIGAALVDVARLAPILMYCKEDGSIRHGFEMVSHPMSPEFFREAYPRDLMPELAKNAEAKPSVGIHVHMSKRAFTEEHLFRWLYFHNKYSDWVKQGVAGRSSVYAAFNWAPDDSTVYRRANGRFGYYHRRLKESEREKASRKMFRSWLKGEQYERSVAVNLLPRTTVENRYFKSTVNFNRLALYIDWLESFFYFSQDATLASKTRPETCVTPENYVRWLRDRTTETEYEHAKVFFLEEGGISANVSSRYA